MPWKTEFKYWGFGLKITSEIEFPELYPCTFEQPEVTIKLGNIPPLPDEKILENRFFKCILGKNDVFFLMAGTANYHVQNGSTILIEPIAALADTRNLRLFILSFPIMAILWQRWLVPLHASAVLHNNQLACIAGGSGVGKSTSVAGLSKRGYSVFSDDVVVVNSVLMTSTTYPMMRLWEDAQEMLNDEVLSNRSFAIKQGFNKFGVFFHQSFDTGAYPIKKIFILKKEDVPAVTSRPLNNAETFFEVRKHVFRRIFAQSKELRALTFRIVSGITSNCRVYEITRPVICDIEVLVNEIENLLE